jgi:hypothetical protein
MNAHLFILQIKNFRRLKVFSLATIGVMALTLMAGANGEVCASCDLPLEITGEFAHYKNTDTVRSIVGGVGGSSRFYRMLIQ